ncbi:Transposase IS4 [Popillia japonica]|uniref:Transposase IS4 n=1 Tax=Popillia japonica TaxID=7064 RepID=A0AAW1MIW0_POPJA
MVETAKTIYRCFTACYYIKHTYNNRMGEVDLSDQSVNTYRIGIRGKKWWWVLFTYMLDLAMTNAWKVYLLVSNNKISQLEFTRMWSYEKEQEELGRLMEDVIINEEIHYDDESYQSEVDNVEGRVDNSDTEQGISAGESDTEMTKNEVSFLGKNETFFCQKCSH